MEASSLKRSTRRFTGADAKRLGQLSWWQFAERRAAALELERGTLTVLEFDVRRAFRLHNCLGPPCCPTEWLMEVEGARELVFVRTWDWLREPSHNVFPGAHLVVAILPVSGNVWNAEATGRTFEAFETTDEARFAWTLEKPARDVEVWRAATFLSLSQTQPGLSSISRRAS